MISYKQIQLIIKVGTGKLINITERLKNLSPSTPHNLNTYLFTSSNQIIYLNFVCQP